MRSICSRAEPRSRLWWLLLRSFQVIASLCLGAILGSALQKDMARVRKEEPAHTAAAKGYTVFFNRAGIFVMSPEMQAPVKVTEAQLKALAGAPYDPTFHQKIQKF